MTHFPPVAGRPGFVRVTVAAGRSVQQDAHAGFQDTPNGPKQVLASVTKMAGSSIEVSEEDAGALLAGGYIVNPDGTPIDVRPEPKNPAGIGASAGRSYGMDRPPSHELA